MKTPAGRPLIMSAAQIRHELALAQPTADNLNRRLICAANEERFQTATYQEALTEFTTGYLDKNDLRALLDAIAPEVPVGDRRFEYKAWANGEYFFYDTDDGREIGGAFKAVQYSGSTVLGKTINRGLTTRVDNDERFGDDWQERAVMKLTQRLLRNELIRAVAVLQAGATAFASPTWKSDGTASVAPDTDLQNAIQASIDASGIMPNRCIMGQKAWVQRQFAYASINTPNAGVAANLNEAQLAGKLKLEDLVVFMPRYQTGVSTKSSVVGLFAYVFDAQKGIGKDDPSNFKRFTSPTDGGSPMRVYVEPHAKYTDITVEHYSNVLACSTLGIEQLTIGTT